MFSIVVAIGALLCLSEHGLHLSPTIKTSRQFLALSVIHSGFWRFTGPVFGIGTQTGIF